MEGERQKLKVTGGAEMGWVNATWPFARLSATREELVLSAGFLGSYSFKPGEVVALEARGTIPLAGRSVRIVHANPAYPEKMVFWCFGSPQKLIDQILGLGFRPSASPLLVPKRGGMAFRWSFLIALFVVWNALFLLDGHGTWGERRQMGPLSLLAMALMLCAALGMLFSRRFSALALKPGRSVSEVRPLIMLILAIGAIFLVVLTFNHLLG